MARGYASRERWGSTARSAVAARGDRPRRARPRRRARSLAGRTARARVAAVEPGHVGAKGGGRGLPQAPRAVRDLVLERAAVPLARVAPVVLGDEGHLRPASARAGVPLAVRRLPSHSPPSRLGSGFGREQRLGASGDRAPRRAARGRLVVGEPSEERDGGAREELRDERPRPGGRRRRARGAERRSAGSARRSRDGAGSPARAGGRQQAEADDARQGPCLPQVELGARGGRSGARNTRSTS